MAFWADIPFKYSFINPKTYCYNDVAPHKFANHADTLSLSLIVGIEDSGSMTRKYWIEFK